MKRVFQKSFPLLGGSPFLLLGMIGLAQSPGTQLGREVAIPAHLQDGDEFKTPLAQLIEYGRRLFDAKFTVQEGAGRPMSKGTGASLSNGYRPECR